jgi:hypothetical protein
MTLFQLRMTSTEGLFRFFVHGTITLFIAACLENFLGSPAFRDIQIQSGKPHYIPVDIASGLAPAFYPQNSPIGTHNAESILPAVPRCIAKNLVKDA